MSNREQLIADLKKLSNKLKEEARLNAFNRERAYYFGDDLYQSPYSLELSAHRIDELIERYEREISGSPDAVSGDNLHQSVL